MQIQVKFIAHGANSIIGGFVAGDVMRCGEEMARHLVDAGVAVYLVSQETKDVDMVNKSRKKKAG